MELRFEYLYLYNPSIGQVGNFYEYQLPVEVKITDEAWGNPWITCFNDGFSTITATWSVEVIDPRGNVRATNTKTQELPPSSGSGLSTDYVTFNIEGIWKVRAISGSLTKVWDIVKVGKVVGPPPEAIYGILFYNPYKQRYESTVPVVPLNAPVGVRFTSKNWLEEAEYLSTAVTITYADGRSASFFGLSEYRFPGEEFTYECIDTEGSRVEGNAMADITIYRAGNRPAWWLEGVKVARASATAPPLPQPEKYAIERVEYYNPLNGQWIATVPVAYYNEDIGIFLVIRNNTTSRANWTCNFVFKDGAGKIVYQPSPQTGFVEPGTICTTCPAQTQTVFTNWALGNITAEIGIAIDGESLDWVGVIGKLESAGPPSGNAVLTGKVTDYYSGAALANALVSLDGLKNRTDVSGNYTFPGVKPGAYTLEASADGYETFTQAVTLKEGTNTITIKLKPVLAGEANLYGEVVTEEKQPAAGAKIILDSKQTETDYTGTFKFLGLDAKEYTLICSKTGYKSIAQKIILQAGDNSVKIILAKAGVSTGTLLWIGLGCAAAAGLALAIPKKKKKEEIKKKPKA